MLMNYFRFFKSITLVLVLTVFAVLTLSSCDKSKNSGAFNDNTVSSFSSERESENSESNSVNSESNSEENSEISEISEKNSESSEENSTALEKPITSSSTSPQETEKTEDDELSDYKSDEKVSVTLKNFVADQCLKIENIGESDGVLCISVKNVSDKDIEYCVLKCKAGNEDASFSFSVLPKNQTAVAVERNKLKFAEDMVLTAWRVEDRVDFENDISLHDDVFEITGEGNSIEIKNISQNDIKGKIKICYKHLQSQELYSSNAFLLSVDGLERGETKQLFPKYFNSDNSKVIYISYDK
ncbi:MAG: hypothetical protein ACI4F5_02385 [Acutalibacteraceae bacterium]